MHHAVATKELNRFKDAHEQTLNAEKRNQNERFINDKKARQSEKQTLAGMKAQNRLLKERMALYHRVNGAIDSIQQQVVGGLRNALMMSGIAVMSFGYKIQQLTSDFIAFEKELMNAQSIYQQSFDILYDLSDEIVQFGTQYGVALQDYLFEQEINTELLFEEIFNQIQFYIPEITLVDTDIDFIPDEHTLNIKVTYRFNLDRSEDAITITI